MAIHLADMFERHGALSCFVQERKHKCVKRFAKDHLCKKRPEKAVMIQLTAQHTHDIQNIRGLSLECEFECATAASKRLLSALQQLRPGTHAAVSTLEAHTEVGGTIRRGDILLMGTDRGHVAVQVWFHVKCDGAPPQSLVQILITKQVHASEHFSRHVIDDARDPVLIPFSSLKSAVVYRRVDDDITCIWPVEYRKLFC